MPAIDTDLFLSLEERLDFVSQSLLNIKTRWLATLEKINSNLRSLDFPEVKAALMEGRFVKRETDDEIKSDGDER